MDLGFANHVFNMLQGFQETRRLGDGEMYLTIGDETRVLVLFIGFLHLYFRSKVLILSSCLYVY